MGDKEKAIKELKEIRKSGLFNMIDRKRVLNYANENQMFNLVCYVENDSSKYWDLLKQL